MKLRCLPHRRAIAIALFPLRNPITEATGCLAGMAILVWHQMPSQNQTFLLPCYPTENLSQMTARLSEDCFPPPFGHEHYMNLQSHFEWDRL